MRSERSTENEDNISGHEFTEIYDRSFPLSLSLSLCPSLSTRGPIFRNESPPRCTGPCDLNAGETDSMDSGYGGRSGGKERRRRRKKFLCPAQKRFHGVYDPPDYLSSDVARPHFFPPPFLVINPLARTHPFCGEFFRGIRTPRFFPSWNLCLRGMKRLVLLSRVENSILVRLSRVLTARRG